MLYTAFGNTYWSKKFRTDCLFGAAGMETKIIIPLLPLAISKLQWKWISHEELHSITFHYALIGRDTILKAKFSLGEMSFFLSMFEQNLYSLLEENKKKSVFIYVLLLLFQIALIAVGKKNNKHCPRQMQHR